MRFKVKVPSPLYLPPVAQKCLGRASGFPAGFRPDSNRVSLKIGPPACLRPAGWPILTSARVDSGRNPARKRSPTSSRRRPGPKPAIHDSPRIRAAHSPRTAVENRSPEPLSGPLAFSDSRISALGLGPETFKIRPRRAGFQPSGPGETFVLLWRGRRLQSRVGRPGGGPVLAPSGCPGESSKVANSHFPPRGGGHDKNIKPLQAQPGMSWGLVFSTIRRRRITVSDIRNGH
jgi:hypothetical protein